MFTLYFLPFSPFIILHFPSRQEWERITRPINKNHEITKTLINFGTRFGKREKVIFAKKIKAWI
jgi:hypothetical protein